MSKARTLLVMCSIAMAATLGACGDDADVDSGTTTTSEITSTSTSSSSTATTGATSTSTGSGATLDCGTVGFTPASEDAASQIKATGVSCEDARAFVQAAGARTSSGGPPQVTVNGYRCVLTSSVEDPLPVANYECTDGSKKITFARS